jgi:5-dehydro-2-deoxygluconokinase
MTPIITQLRQYDIQPDVWKLEGMENKDDYIKVVEKIKEGERINVGLVILGRGENREKAVETISNNFLHFYNIFISQEKN